MPDAAPAAPPEPPRDRFGAALPVALTAIATALAGLSTTEMTQAMFWRGGAAQDQAKATNQWTLAGFKRDRALACEIAAAQLRANSPPAPNLSTPPDAADTQRRAAAWLGGDELPPAKLPPVDDPDIASLLDAVREHREDEAAALAAKRRPDAVTAVIAKAERAVEEIDRDWTPVVSAAAKLRDAAPGAGAQAAWYALEQRRYRAESSLNQGVGYLYEARVRLMSAESDRHKRRSGNFFYAMLAAQLGATLASLGLARQRRSLFWGMAGASGMIAVAFGAYVYLTF